MTRKNNCSVFAIFMAMVFLCVSTAHADWKQQIKNLLNIIATPIARLADLKAPSDMQAGSIFISSVDGDMPRAITNDGGYISPVFSANDSELLALRGDEVVSLPLSGGEPKMLYKLANAVKLLGMNRQDGNKLLVLLRTAEGETELSEMALDNGQVKLLPHDTDDNEQQQILKQLGGNDRNYGDGTLIYLQPESKDGMSGHRIEWTDIYLKREGQESINVSRCNGQNCSQPTLSRDGRHVVFIRAKSEF